jgi:2-polyprenyl-3-methyl-5-hydroxy-6-metoxy-1,4-benzoquinol methylase
MNCPICLNSETSINYKDYHNDFDIAYCKDCDFEFMDPYKAPTADYYAESTDELSLIRHGKLEKWPATHPSSNSTVFVEGNLDVLDIGCSNGAFAEFVVTEKRCNIVGLDFDRNSIKLANTRRLSDAQFINGDLQDLAKHFPNKKYDVISMFMVLEHIEDPMKLVNQIFDLLKHDGYFIGTVPNEKRYFAKTYNLKSALPPLHLNYWNLDSFKRHITKYSRFTVAKVHNKAHLGYVSYVWKIKAMAHYKNPLIIFAIRAIFTVLSFLEILVEKVTMNGSGTYFELQKK